MKKNLGQSMVLVSMLSAVTLFFSFLRETVTAAYYGVSATTDAYNIATQLPVILFSTISTAIATVIIPAYAKKHAEEGEDKANSFASNFISMLFFLAVCFSLICFIFAPFIISITAPGLATEQKTLAVNYFRIVLPTIVFLLIIKANNGIMNYYGQFRLPVLTINILSITFMLFVILFTKRIGIKAAVYGSVVGTALEFIASCLLRRRFMKYKPVLDFRDTEIRSTLRLSVPVFIGIGVEEIGKIVDKMISSLLDAGSITALNYGSKLSTAVSSLMLSGISTVSYPEFTKAAASHDDRRTGDVYNFSVRMYCLILIPVVIGGVILENEIIMVVFQRGAFDMEAVYRTAPLFACYLISLLFSSLRSLSSNYLYAYRDTRTPMINSSLGIGMNIVLSLALSRVLHAVGIALATAVSTACVSVLLSRVVKKRNPYVSFKAQFKSIIKFLTASLGMLVVIFCLKKALVYFRIYNMTSFKFNVIYIVLSVLLGAGTYCSLLFFMKCNELTVALDRIKRRIIK